MTALSHIMKRRIIESRIVTRQMNFREKLTNTATSVAVLSAGEQFLNDLKEGILKQLGGDQLSVELLADQVGISRVQLYLKISGLTNMSVNELIRRLRLQRTAQLRGPSLQVAYEVAFLNLSYFSKVFK